MTDAELYDDLGTNEPDMDRLAAIGNFIKDLYAALNQYPVRRDEEYSTALAWDALLSEIPVETMKGRHKNSLLDFCARQHSDNAAKVLRVYQALFVAPMRVVAEEKAQRERSQSLAAIPPATGPGRTRLIEFLTENGYGPERLDAMKDEVGR